jgi:hypothetical protein
MGRHAGWRPRLRKFAMVASVAVFALAGGCGDLATPARSAPAADAPVITPRDPVVSIPAEPGCPEVAFDPTASLGPEFQADVFAHDESEAITRAFLHALAAQYAGGSSRDACESFTATGLQSAIAADARLREVRQGELLIQGDLVLRIAFEGTYDLRRRPPVLPIDAIFDIAAGAVEVDQPTGTRTTTTSDERAALHIDFMFDGHRWRADRVGSVSPEYEEFAQLPSPLPPAPRCTGFARDPANPSFDEDAGSSGRVWCDADGRGRIVRQPDQLVLFTRYPCDAGHASVLTIGHPLGAGIDRLARYEYVRDPAGEFIAQGWVTAAYVPRAALPDDATYTGWTNGNIELWVSPSELDRAIYVRRGKSVERWPRAAKEWGVVDCN